MADISPNHSNGGLIDDNVVEPLTTGNDPNSLEKSDSRILPSPVEPSKLETPKVPVWKLFWEEFKPGYILDHFDYASFKIIIRSWLAMWIGDLFAVITVIHVWLENAPYIMPIIGCIVAPGGQPFILTLLMNFLCGLFMIYGWTHAVIASAITVRMRGFPSSETTVVELVKSGVCANDATLRDCVQLHLFSGEFLELRYSVIFIFAMLFGLFSMAWLKQLSPLLIAPFTVGVISLCVNISFGALVPYFADRTIGVSIIIIFGSPPSTNRFSILF